MRDRWLATAKPQRVTDGPERPAMRTNRTILCVAAVLLGSICLHPTAVLAADEIGRPDERRGARCFQLPSGR